MKLPGLAIIRFTAIVLGTTMLFAVLGCDATPDLLTNSEQDSLNKLRSG